jgi:2-haloacid dehalogenase
MAIRVLAFDFNGTLTDLSFLDPAFRREFGGSRVRREWFSEALQLAFAVTAAGQYEPFADILSAALQVIEQRYDRKLSAAKRKGILLSMRSAPAFPDVRPALTRLRSRGFRAVVLTNSGEQAAKQGLHAAGIADLFEKILSADSAKRLKPAAEVYEMAARKCGVKKREMLLVAAHSWDVAGSIHAGFRGAFVSRPGEVLNQLAPKPDYVVADLKALAEQLIE